MENGPSMHDSHLKKSGVLGLKCDSVVMLYLVLKSSELLAGLMVYPGVSQSFIVVHLEPVGMLEQTAK